MKKNVIQIAKATCLAVVCSLVLVLIFTFIIQLFSLSSAAIKPVNQVIKIVSIALGGIVFISGDKGLLKGGIYGVVAVVLTYLLFAIIAGEFSFSWKIIIELLIGGVAGGIAGVIAVNIKK
jgi:putative membrane protein (TIGR04086 family)